MTTLTNVRLIDPEAGTDTLGAVRIEAGRIAEITPGGMGDLAAVDCAGMCLAPGIVDFGVKVCEPGERHKESYRSAGDAAVAGGITTLVTRPDTDPPVDSPEALAFVARRAAEDAIPHVHHMAALTKGRQGAEMTEIGFLRDAGAVAFTDGDTVTQDAKIAQRAWTYAAGLGALVVAHPQDPSLSKGAVMTSSAFASKLGLPAVSPQAERMGLERDLALVEMTGVAYHADQITCAAALEPLARARAQGLDVSAGTSVHHATLNLFDVDDYRTFFKVKPPLRAEEDRQAVVAALAAGEIDVICSMHTPQDEESKRLPFEAAASGAVGLETLLPAALQLVHGGHMDLPHLWRALSLNPAKRLGLSTGRLAEGAPADLVLFDPNTPFKLDRWTLRSKSKNTPYDLRRLQGRVQATWVGGEQVFGAVV
ncbi:MAG: dihydroorotase [Pseudomonadota bacterium]